MLGFSCCNTTKNILKRNCTDVIVWNLRKSSSTKPKNHYETLNLSKSCSTKEIRDAFISLSKQYHPDKNKDNPNAQEQFVKVNEAYNVLIKPESRRDYDVSLQWGDPYRGYGSPTKNDFYEVHRYDSHYRDPWKDPSFARNRNFNEENTKDYYGIKGLKRQTNERILFWIITFAGIGLFLQIIVLRFANNSHRNVLNQRSEEYKRHVEYLRARAHFYGTRERQIQQYKRRAGMPEEEVINVVTDESHEQK